MVFNENRGIKSIFNYLVTNLYVIIQKINLWYNGYSNYLTTVANIECEQNFFLLHLIPRYIQSVPTDI